MLKIVNLFKRIKKLYLLKFGTTKKIIDYWRTKGVKIGDNCVIYGNVNFGSEPFLVKVGDNVKITSNVNFITHDGGVHTIRHKYFEYDADLFGNIEVGNNVFIGYNVLILPGVKIGDNCIVGAGSIVTKNIQNNSVYAGVPAKFICTIDRYYEKNKKKLEYTKRLTQLEKETYLKEKYKSEI